MMTSILWYFIALFVFLAIDFVWLAVIAKGLYRKNIGHLMASKANYFIAGIFYLVFVFGLLIFVLIPAIEKVSIMHAVIYGAIYGLVTYATYDLTNHATLKDWPLKVTIIDLIWGTTVSVLTSLLSYLIITAIW